MDWPFKLCALISIRSDANADPRLDRKRRRSTSPGTEFKSRRAYPRQLARRNVSETLGVVSRRSIVQLLIAFARSESLDFRPMLRLDWWVA